MAGGTLDFDGEAGGIEVRERDVAKGWFFVGDVDGESLA